MKESCFVFYGYKIMLLIWMSSLIVAGVAWHTSGHGAAHVCQLVGRQEELLTRPYLAINLNRVILFIVGKVERFVDVLAVVDDLLLGVREALGHEVQGLHLTDGEVEVVQCNVLRVERLKLWLLAHAIVELAEAAEQTGTISFFLTVSVEAHAELDREPVDGGETLELDLAGAQRG